MPCSLSGSARVLAAFVAKAESLLKEAGAAADMVAHVAHLRTRVIRNCGIRHVAAGTSDTNASDH